MVGATEPCNSECARSPHRADPHIEVHVHESNALWIGGVIMIG